MRMRHIAIAGLLLGCTVLPVVGLFAYDALLRRGLTADIIARAPELGNFTPNRITVPVGKKVRLRIRNVDTVNHGFAIPELDVDAGTIRAGHAKVLEFTPLETGTYDFYCTVWCSEYHLKMRGELQVIPQ